MPYDGTTTSPQYSLKAHRARARNAWDENGYWQSIEQQCYDYAIPLRRPVKWGRVEERIDNLFDDTAITSTFHGAGALKEDLFPAGESFFKLQPGPVVRNLAKARGENTASVAAALDAITDQIVPFFQTGEFDQAATELCIDLYAGTGAILPTPGDDANPVRFVCIPADELALEADAYGGIGAAFWKTMQSPRAIKEKFPDGTYPEAFIKALEGDAIEQPIEINQDFCREGKKWVMYVYLAIGADTDPPVKREEYKVQPIIPARYHRVPGETKGRGPIQLSLPAIKTANKAQELTLKAFAIQMLGIWGYRPGGAFNPDTNKLKPGTFWPMNSTGGVLGPDVIRLDPASGRVDYANLVTQGLQARIKENLHDDRVESKGKTPVSAAEYMGSLAKMKTNYIGAFGRLVHELIPKLVMRVMEILYDAGLLQTDLQEIQLFAQIKVTSPLAAAMQLNHLKPFMEYLQVCQALQEDPRRYLHLEEALDDLRGKLDIPAKWWTTAAERQAYDDQKQKQQAAAALQQTMMNKPEVFADAAKQREQQSTPMAP